MTYTVTITNSKIGMTSAQILYLSTISPSLIVNPDKPYEEYVSDVKLDSTDIYVPLYKRNQLVKLPANSVLVIYTEDSEEAAYYKSQRLDGSSVLVDPDPITGDSIVDSLKNLYVALGNDASSVENANTILEVLNVMSESYQGESNASSISDAVDNIAAVADNISGGGGLSSNFEILAPDVIESGGPMPNQIVPSIRPNTIIQSDVYFSNSDGEVTVNGNAVRAVVYGDVNRINVVHYMFYQTIKFRVGDNFDGVYINNEKKEIPTVTISAGNYYTILIYQDGIKEAETSGNGIEPLN